ncbi:MAG: signal peptidase I [Candidatus Brocadiae bacterium]|nr:signal peptidase I [Candidatus Brocadiia bacterium]
MNKCVSVIFDFFCSIFPYPGMKYEPGIREWMNTFLYVGIFYLACTTIFVEGYQIPSGSMEPTFHGDPGFFTGDRIFALKGISQFFPLKRGDIVIFLSAEDQETFIVKRLVGLPGDKIQIKNNKIYVNDEMLKDHPVFEKNDYYIPRFKEVADGWEYEQTFAWDPYSKPIKVYAETKEPKLKWPSIIEQLILFFRTDYIWQDTRGKVLPPIMKFKTPYSELPTGKFIRCFGQAPYIVPKDCYFVMGDNSASSNDSRYWGFLPKSNLLGRASMIWWPIQRGRIIR